MRLSALQKFILVSCCANARGLKSKDEFFSYYRKEDLAKNRKNIQDTIHSSIDSLVMRDLLIAYGRKTAKKWHIDKVKLTSGGRRAGYDIIRSRQRRLPLNN